jgi:cytosine/adenosine deaminase-related metal-dependent hydrolase
MVTENPVRMFDYGAQIGTLRPGGKADFSLLELLAGESEFEDGDGVKRSEEKIARYS